MQKKAIVNKTIDAYAAVYKAGDNAYHFVKSLQENTEERVVQATARDIQREGNDISYVDAQLQACMEVKCMRAAASGGGRAKRVRQALQAEKAEASQGSGAPNLGLAGV